MCYFVTLLPFVGVTLLLCYLLLVDCHMDEGGKYIAEREIVTGRKEKVQKK